MPRLMFQVLQRATDFSGGSYKVQWGRNWVIDGGPQHLTTGLSEEEPTPLVGWERWVGDPLLHPDTLAYLQTLPNPPQFGTCSECGCPTHESDYCSPGCRG